MIHEQCGSCGGPADQDGLCAACKRAFNPVLETGAPEQAPAVSAFAEALAEPDPAPLPFPAFRVGADPATADAPSVIALKSAVIPSSSERKTVEETAISAPLLDELFAALESTPIRVKTPEPPAVPEPPAPAQSFDSGFTPTPADPFADPFTPAVRAPEPSPFAQFAEPEMITVVEPAPVRVEPAPVRMVVEPAPDDFAAPVPAVPVTPLKTEAPREQPAQPQQVAHSEWLTQTQPMPLSQPTVPQPQTVPQVSSPVLPQAPFEAPAVEKAAAMNVQPAVVITPIAEAPQRVPVPQPAVKAAAQAAPKGGSLRSLVAAAAVIAIIGVIGVPLTKLWLQRAGAQPVEQAAAPQPQRPQPQPHKAAARATQPPAQAPAAVNPPATATAIAAPKVTPNAPPRVGVPSAPPAAMVRNPDLVVPPAPARPAPRPTPPAPPAAQPPAIATLAPAVAAPNVVAISEAPEPVAVPSPLPAAYDTPAAGPFYELNDVDRPPRAASKVEPTLPAALQGRTVNEIVVVRVLVSQAGRPVLVSLLRQSKSGLALDEAVIAAVKQWTFTPAVKRGASVSCFYHVGVPVRAQ